MGELRAEFARIPIFRTGAATLGLKTTRSLGGHVIIWIRNYTKEQPGSEMVTKLNMSLVTLQ